MQSVWQTASTYNVRWVPQVAQSQWASEARALVVIKTVDDQLRRLRAFSSLLCLMLRACALSMFSTLVVPFAARKSRDHLCRS
jgi:hypothetical protein